MPAFAITPDRSFLAAYRLPPLRFETTPALPSALWPVWSALGRQDFRRGAHDARVLLSERRDLNAEVQAALTAAMAAAALFQGQYETAYRLARRAASLHEGQWMATRIMVESMAGQQRYKQALRILLTTDALPRPATAWDEALPDREVQVARAAFAWRTGAWKQVQAFLDDAYPAGPAAMTRPLQEDAFRLAHYRDDAERAERIAHLLILDAPEPLIDSVLQTLVQRKWMAQALALYREAFGRAPRSPLMRRRLVGLCIRQGDLAEARRLSSANPLELAA